VRATFAAIVLAGLCSTVGIAAESDGATADVIAVATNADGGRDTDIALVAPDGRVLRFLTWNALNELDPSWSPDRRRIAFARVGVRRGGIHIIDIASRSVRRLTHGTDVAPAFSPDGKHVAFVRGSSIRIIDAGTRAQRLLVRTRWAPRQLGWSPDGRSILFGDGGYIRLLDVAARRLTTLPVGGGDSNFRPVFAHDGRTIAFLGNRDERYFRDPQAWGIFLANVDGSNVRKVHTGKYGPTSWSPDGTRLAVQYGHEISVVDVAAGGRTVLLPRGRNDHAAFAPRRTANRPG
jgi:Tol biopolymer transport system component